MKARYVIVTAILALFSSIAIAGLTTPAPVIVDLENRVAQGDMWTARTAKNDVEFIGCGTRMTDDGINPPFLFGFCQAADADDVQILCVTQNPGLLDYMNSASDFSYVTFGWNELDECTSVGFSTQSFYLPNFKIQKGMGDDDD